MNTTNVMIIFAQYLGRHACEIAPNAVEAWDQETIDNNYDGWQDDVLSHTKGIGERYENVAVLQVAVDSNLIHGKVESDFDPDKDNYFHDHDDKTLVRLLVAVHDEADGQHWGSVVSTWDQYVLDENYDGFMEDLEKVKSENPNTTIRVVDVFVPNKAIDNALSPWNTIHNVEARSA